MDVVVSKSEVCGRATPPPSKSYSHRALIAASLSKKTIIKNVLISEDTIATIDGCRKMGAEILRRRDKFEIFGTEEIKNGYYYFANSGTTLRIFMGLLSTAKGISTLDGDPSLRSRPNLELAMAIKKLGGKVYGYGDYKAPVKVEGVIKGGHLKFSAPSSQFVSSLLFSLPFGIEESVLEVESVKSRPYIDITLHVLRDSNVKFKVEDKSFVVYPSAFKLRNFSVPADFSSASYLIAAGLLAGKVEIQNMYDSMQGDKMIVDVARQMGGGVEWNKDNGTIIAEKSELEGIDFDASDNPDLVPTIAILGAAAKGETIIRNAEHLRIKETDRIKTICSNLRALGFEVEELKDGMKIKGQSGRFVGTVDSFGDHRIAMSFALLGLIGKIKILNAEVVSVSFPAFFDVLKSLGAKVS